MAQKSIPNLTPAVFLSPTAQLEIVQDGASYRTSAQQIANLKPDPMIYTDTATTTTTFPIFSKLRTGKLLTVYTSDPHYTYTPSEGRLSAYRPESTQGIFLNKNSVTLNYAIPVGDNAMSCGPLTVSATVTVPDGSAWAII